MTVTILSPSIPTELDECYYVPRLTENADVASRTRKRKGSIHTSHSDPSGNLQAAFTTRNEDKTAASLCSCEGFLNQSL